MPSNKSKIFKTLEKSEITILYFVYLIYSLFNQTLALLKSKYDL